MSYPKLTSLCLSLLAIGLNLSAYGDSPLADTPRKLFKRNSAECKALVSVYEDTNLSNKGWGTLTFTHPEFTARFDLSRMLSKIKQVHPGNGQEQLLRNMIRSFLSTRVEGVAQEQPLRPFVVPELLCPLVTLNGQKEKFCDTFKNNPVQSMIDARMFLDTKVSFRNLAAIDKVFKPLAVVIRPQRHDFPASQQAVEFRVVYGLRNAANTERKPATLILEFSASKDPEFYVAIANSYLVHKDRNDRTDREAWAGELEHHMDCFSLGKCAAKNGWTLNQIRVNELAFRGDDVLWNLREFNFPAIDSTADQFRQVAVAFTPWVDFAKQDIDPIAMNADFEAFLQDKGLSAGSLSPDLSIDLFEEFMGERPTPILNTESLEQYVRNKLATLVNSNGMVINFAYAYHRDPLTMAPSALARPGMKFFEGDDPWSKTLKETCQGCHVATSSIASQEKVTTLQNFYQISPRIRPLGPEAGPQVAGSNILSPFVLKETGLRYRSFISTIGCLPAAIIINPSSVDDDSENAVTNDGHSSPR